ncbi:MAG: diacylglycerol kinase family protein [Candidatus Omnitrophica bacterium]|nr:diacylglycerol kinase family protein [Candidatus Omnitrophota bacterium]
MAKGDMIRNIFRVRGFLKSVSIALKGILYLFLYHRNMRLIFIIGIISFLSGLLWFKLAGIELIALCITITLVFMAEIFNTAIELLMDILTKEYHTKIKLVKDIAAGVVILAILNSIAVGYVLFVRKLFK